MSRKNIILTIVIVVLLGGAGYVVYTGFFKGNTPSTTPTPATLTATGNSTVTTSPITPTPGAGATTATNSPPAAPALVRSGKILPLGTRLDFTLIKKYNPDSKLFSYPKVDPSEI